MGTIKIKGGEVGEVMKCKVHIVPKREDVMCMSQGTGSKQRSVLSWQYREIPAKGKTYFTDLQVNA